MNIKKILKIVAFIVGPILPLLILFYFLYPLFNEAKYEEIVKKYDETTMVEADSSADSTVVDQIGEDFATLKERSMVFQNGMQDLNAEIDSLEMANDSLENVVLAHKERISALQDTLQAKHDYIALKEKKAAEKIVTGQEFTERIKSLLSLDDENLVPIINELSDEQLVRLYEAGSSRQRKKILRTLKSKRAANLMSEVM